MQVENLSPYTLPKETTVGQVALRVGDLERSLGFYRDVLGYRVEEVGGGTVRLFSGQGRDYDFELHEAPGVKPAPRRATGLYHAAILLPTRKDLALATRQLVSHGLRFGQGDHGVSEALYLDDPDGNGLEIYADRPRGEWPFRDGQIWMGTAAVDFESLLGEVPETETWTGIPEGTTIGHIHLKVSDIASARRFYADLLGFDVTLDALPSALFLSAGGYHHHLGSNTWESQGAGPAGPDHAGLLSYAITLPDSASRDALTARLESAGTEVTKDGDTVAITDMDGNRVVLTVG